MRAQDFKIQVNSRSASASRGLSGLAGCVSGGTALPCVSFCVDASRGIDSELLAFSMSLSGDSLCVFASLVFDIPHAQSKERKCCVSGTRPGIWVASGKSKDCPTETGERVPANRRAHACT